MITEWDHFRCDEALPYPSSKRNYEEPDKTLELIRIGSRRAEMRQSVKSSITMTEFDAEYLRDQLGIFDDDDEDKAGEITCAPGASDIKPTMPQRQQSTKKITAIDREPPLPLRRDSVVWYGSAPKGDKVPAIPGRRVSVFVSSHGSEQKPVTGQIVSIVREERNEGVTT